MLEEEIGALVGAGSARKTEGENVGVKRDSLFLANYAEQFLLGREMSLTDLFQRNTYCVTEVGVLSSSPCYVTVKESGKPRTCPGNRVHSISYRADGVAGEHATRNLAMTHGNPVHITGEAKRQIGHIQVVTVPGISLIQQTCPVFS